jgi:general secretion pathway protein G
LGTGVGGGLILDGRLYRGPRGLAAELGHMSIDLNGRPCLCGSRGCLEAYAGAVAIRVTGYMDTAKANRAKSDLATIVDAVESYYLHHSRYPSNEEGLAKLPLKNRLDPWGREYMYNSPGQNEPFEVFTLGADGREGGDGIDADIYSWQLGQVDEEA